MLSSRAGVVSRVSMACDDQDLVHQAGAVMSAYEADLAGPGLMDQLDAVATLLGNALALASMHGSDAATRAVNVDGQHVETRLASDFATAARASDLQSRGELTVAMDSLAKALADTQLGIARSEAAAADGGRGGGGDDDVGDGGDGGGADGGGGWKAQVYMVDRDCNDLASRQQLRREIEELSAPPPERASPFNQTSRADRASRLWKLSEAIAQGRCGAVACLQPWHTGGHTVQTVGLSTGCVAASMFAEAVARVNRCHL